MTNLKSLRSMAGLTALACLATINILAESSVPSRVTKRVDETRLTTLKGHTLPIVNARNDRGPVEDGLNLDRMTLVLQRSAEQEKELGKLMDEQNDKNSPNFHKWLTAVEFGERFGVSQEDIDQVTAWLESHGFHVDQVFPSHMAIEFSGSAGSLREGFHTSIHRFDLKGEMHMANISNPSIPEALTSVVAGIASLSDLKPKPMHESASQYTFAGCTNATGPGTCYGVTPQDNQAIYNLNPLYAAGVSGQGQTIYLVEDTDTYGGAADWNSYRSAFGLASAYPSATYTQTHPGSCTDPGSNADDGEAAIDVEVASAIAPSAAIQLISCPSTNFSFGGQVALQNLINSTSPTVGVVSVSYGLCEALTGQGGVQAFSNTYQQAAAEGFSVFVSSGDEGASSCSNLFSSYSSGYDTASIGISGWGQSAYNVSVGGTDFEDTYNSKKANVSEGGSTIPMSTYWNATNTAGFGSAKSYIPEIPWNDACASALISEVLTGSFTPYGASPAACNNASYDTSTTFLIPAAGSGGASNCAIGAAGTSQSSYLVSGPECQGSPKPSWQSAYGVPTDGVRDIPDVSMFAANGLFGHYEVVCWSDPAYTTDGAASCSGAPSTWSGFGGTSVASPTMAAVQALVNQQTGTQWGNVVPYYYQIGQSEYGTLGGTFAGSACNSSTAGGPASGCVFNDVTQGDIDLACRDNGTTQESACYKPTGTNGVDSTDSITVGATGASVINGGTGYTTAPTCTVAGPSNAAPYISPAGTTLYAGGTKATCTATVAAGSTTAAWTIAISSTTAAGEPLTFVNSSGTVLGNYTLTGASTTTIATALAAYINTTSFATATSSTKTVTLTAKTAGYAGMFYPYWVDYEAPEYIVITNTTKGQGPNYVSGVTIVAGGVGYAPETPITLTGTGSGAIAVANTTPGTAAGTYQPTYGAAPGYDLATGLGTPNSYNLVNASIWYKPQSITVVSAAPTTGANGSSFSVEATATSGLPVTYSSSGSCTNSGARYTITANSGTCVVTFSQAGGSDYSAAAPVSENVTATPAVVVGPVSLSTVLTVSGSAGTGYSMTVTISNTGTGTATSVMLNTATLNGVAGSVPVAVGSIAGGTSAHVMISYPGSTGADNAKVVGSVSGTYTGGTFSATQRVTLP